MFKVLTSMFIFFNVFRVVNPFNLCIVGANGGLGRELVSQSINNYNCSVLALTGKNLLINKPFRGKGFNEQSQMDRFYHPNLVIDNYWNNIQDEYEHLIFCTGAGPFRGDFSDKLTSKMLNSLPSSCESIDLVSAWGVGDSLTDSDWGIQIMNSWYLQDTYRAKNEQERLLENFERDIQKRTYRPKALSFGETFFESTSRFQLASEILENIYQSK